jgi:multidrug efflux pump subunit AcrB
VASTNLKVLADGPAFYSNLAIKQAVEAQAGWTSRYHGILRGAEELAVPILVSTMTNMFASLPMLNIIGYVGEYIASPSVVVSTTMAESYLLALAVTPIICLVAALFTRTTTMTCRR